MRLTFLGTGSAMPTGRHAQSGTLLETDDGTLLVDCGSGVLDALARTDTGYEGVDAVLLTHHHLDHVSDLDVLMKARWLAGETDLTIAGPPGTAELVADLLSVHGYMQDRLDLRLVDIEASTFSLAGFDGEWLETRHSMQCFAYRLALSAGGPAVALSGDSEAFPELVEFADGAAVHNDGPVRIDISVREAGDDAVVAVFADDGSGVPEEIRSEIFEMGAKGPDSSGTGFGLGFVRALTESYGGGVTVGQSDLGGAEFRVTLLQA